ncbi:MAG TPA: hypothetical protein VK864_06485, partial [Longimicrobiales bacterium]|nr:hypothetical protein [Longimicrobiales bacterium]
PPSCTTCHGGHGLSISPDSTLAVAGQQRCAGCHEHYAETFGESYHGQAATLEDGDAAVCSDCHSAHAIHPTDDPRSTVAAANLVETCSRCHPNANAGFIQFAPHADAHDAENNPLLYWTYRFMTALLIGVMTVFGLHSIVWVVRVALDRSRARRAATQGGKS